MSRIVSYVYVPTRENARDVRNVEPLNDHLLRGGLAGDLLVRAAVVDEADDEGAVWSSELPSLALADGVPEPVTVAGRAFLYIDEADGDLKIKFGDGVIKTIAEDT